MNSEGSRQPVGTVVIVGGGASGALVATHLLDARERRVDIVLIEPTGLLAAGVAYGTTQPLHLLNAPTCEMSAWSRRPDDFGEYLSERGLTGDGRGYAPRSVYREYLLDCLGRAPGRASDERP